jgi:hypothetical protein
MKRAAIAAILTLASFSAQAAEQVRDVKPFKTIAVRGPVHLIVEVGKVQSLRVEGDQKFLDNILTRVVDGELHLDMKQTSNFQMRDHDRIVITVPELASFRGEGAGLVKLNNVRADRFDVNYRGAGSLQMNGQVGKLRLQAQGVGEVEAKNLVAQDADVSFEGIGSVTVHAKQRLNATVHGMGNLTYYGNPRALSKVVAGIGSVVAAR